MGREELMKKFNQLEGMSDGELLKFAFTSFQSNQNKEMVLAIIEYIKQKAMSKNK